MRVRIDPVRTVECGDGSYVAYCVVVDTYGPLLFASYEAQPVLAAARLIESLEARGFEPSVDLAIQARLCAEKLTT